MLADKINSGLSKLFTAKEDVGTMKIELSRRTRISPRLRNLRRSS